MIVTFKALRPLKITHKLCAQAEEGAMNATGVCAILNQ